MKKIMLLFMFLVPVLSGCEKDDAGSMYGSTELKSALLSKHPGATNISWESRGLLKVANFTENGRKCLAWFEEDGYWYMTEANINYEELPAGIRTSFSGSSYRSNWDVNKVQKLSRARIEDIYIIKVKGVENYELFYVADGMLTKTVSEDESYYPDHREEIAPYVNENVYNYISANHAGSKIVEVNVEFPGNPVVDIIEDEYIKTLYFNFSGGCYQIRWYMNPENLDDIDPNVTAAFNACEYKNGYELSKIEFYETYSDSYYHYTLIQNNSEVLLKITPEGEITVKS